MIVCLIGLLMVGGITGGLLIQNLQTSLAQRDELEKQRIAILESTYAAQKENFRAQLGVLSQRADAYQTEFIYTDQELASLYEELVKLGHTNRPVSSVRVARLADELSTSRKRLAFLSDRLKDASREAQATVGGGAGGGPFSARPSSALLWLLLFFVLSLTTFMAYLILRRRRARKMLAE